MYQQISFDEAVSRLKCVPLGRRSIGIVFVRAGHQLAGIFSTKNIWAGLMWEQVPSELAALIRFLWKHHPKLSSYLEIGVGKFGTFITLNAAWQGEGDIPSYLLLIISPTTGMSNLSAISGLATGMKSSPMSGAHKIPLLQAFLRTISSR